MQTAQSLDSIKIINMGHLTKFMEKKHEGFSSANSFAKNWMKYTNDNSGVLRHMIHYIQASYYGLDFVLTLLKLGWFEVQKTCHQLLQSKMR